MINIPKGTKDVLPNDSYKWHYIEKIARETAREFGAKEIRTPVFEHTELFLRGVGDTTDIVNKEMYTFQDKGDRSITLKPEGTAGVGRSFIENSLYSDAMPLKMFYITPDFRYEKPQQGRLREHHQFGTEMYGSASPSMDAEVILLASAFFKKLGVTNLKLKINSIGCKHCREKYNTALKEYFKENLQNMCGTCGERFEKNPLRILDCKVPACAEINKNAPSILDYICEDCSAHFESLKSYLDGIIEYEIDPRIVRGLDYYSKTVFEFVSDNIGAKGTVCGGGRYDGLIEILGGKPNHAVGFGLGLERLLLLLESCGIEIEKPADAEVYIVAVGSEKPLALRLAQTLRQKGFATEYDHMERSFKAQFKYANKLSASYVCIIGGDEAEKGGAKVKDMQSGEEKFASFEEIAKVDSLADIF